MSRSESLSKSFSLTRCFSSKYQRLPQYPIRLSVLKLDGSCFVVQVSRTATLRQLKEALEDVFVESYNDDAHPVVSWSHVWGNFCLSYKGHRLTDDKIRIHSFGIRDEDQLDFVRHMSTNINFEKVRMKHHHRRRNASYRELVV